MRHRDDKAQISWQYTFQAVNGGIREADGDLHLNLAPKDGYRDTVTIGSQASDEDYVVGIDNRRLYFMSNDGKEYGSLFVSMEPFIREEHCALYVESKINPHGSRDLARASLQ